MEYSIGKDIIVDDPQMMLSILTKETGIEDIDLKDIAEFIESQKGTKFYFDNALNGQNPLEARTRIMYLWVDSGFVNEQGQALFISLLNRNGYYSGHFVGTSGYLAGKVVGYWPENKAKIIENELRFREKFKRKSEGREIPNLMGRYKKIVEVKANKVTPPTESQSKSKSYWESDTLDITKEINQLLLVNNWRSIKGLDRYIKIIGARIPQLIAKNKTEYYFLNHLKSAVINTGLIDRFGRYICVIYRKHLTYNLYVPQMIAERRADYSHEGFEQTNGESLLPISFFDDEKFFSATIEDLDITPRSFLHILEERRDRLPEQLKTLSDMALANRIKEAVDTALKFQRCDPTYIKPSYTGTEGIVVWLVPLHIDDRKIGGEPDLVLIFKKMGSFYEAKTILRYDDSVKDRLTALCLYGRLW